MLFKISAYIQEIYFAGIQGSSTQPPLTLYREITAIASASAMKSKKIKLPQFNDAFNASPSFHDFKRKLTVIKIQPVLHSQNPPAIAVNPFCFLPGRECFQLQTGSAQQQLERFYAAVILADLPLLEKTYNGLTLFIKNNSDRAFFDKLYRLTRCILGGQSKTLSQQPVDPEALAYYFLLTGDTQTPFLLGSAQQEKSIEVKKAFIKNIFEKSGIEYNHWTNQNKIYLWLTARESLKNGSYDLAYAALKSTYPPDLLDNFTPDNQVFYYATLRLAVRMNGQAFWEYVYTGLRHLTAHIEQEEIKVLFLIINLIRYPHLNQFRGGFQ